MVVVLTIIFVVRSLKQDCTWFVSHCFDHSNPILSPPIPLLQKTHQSALQVQQKAEALLQANHYDMDLIRDCAESVASHWQQLMLKMEDRLKLVNASVAFYKTSEQVGDTHTGFSIQFD